MRVVFFGTPELAVPSLAHLSERHDVVAVVCQPDRPKGRGRKLQAPPVKAWALEHDIPVHQPTKLNDGTFETWLSGCEPDVCALAAYGRILKQPILDVPAHGFINMHPSLLPKYRGPSPIQSAMMAGETETGISIMRLVVEMDAGDLLYQETTPIGENENAAELTERLSERGGVLMADVADAIAAGTVQATAQDHDAATYCHLLKKDDGLIDWTADAQTVHNLVRGALPWPVAQTRMAGEVYKIHGGMVVDGAGAPGEVIHVERDAIDVATGHGAYRITKIQAPGKRAMDVGDYLRGQSMAVGQTFEAV